MDTSIETLPENKVRLHVAVPAAEFDKALDAAFRKLAREVRIPGFRPGKAPRKLLEARLGTEVARDQALRDSVPEYYRDAIASASRNSFSDGLIREPSRLNTPTAIAMSVAMGIPQPRAPSPPAFNAR